MKNCILFSNINNKRITRTIIGLPSSTDITSYIDPDSDWGAFDFITGEKLTYADCDAGVVYLQEDKMIKISSLIQFGVVGIRTDSLHDCISEDNLIYK